MIQNDLADALLGAVHGAQSRLRGLDDAAAARHASAGRWNAKEILGHLIDSASNNHQRFVRAQYTDDLQFPKYEQNTWVDIQRYDEAEWSVLVDLWESYNRHLAYVIRNMPTEALHSTCVVGENAPASLQFLVEDYLRHMQHHLRQIEERTAAR